MPRALARKETLAPAEPRDRLEASLHDLTNALAAARTFAEVAVRRARAGAGSDPVLLDDLLRELDRAGEILHSARQGLFSPGDAVVCLECGYQFVNRRAAGKQPTCRRCSSVKIERWRP